MEQGLSGTIGIVVVAAGRGERAGTSIEGPKQYRRIGGKPVIWHTLKRFLDWTRTGPVAVVIHPDDHALLAAAINDLAGATTSRSWRAERRVRRRFSTVCGRSVIAGFTT